MKAYMFPKYTNKGPSSRYRTYQYLNYFKMYDVEVFPFFDDNYKPNKPFRLSYLASRYLKRIMQLLKIKKKSIIFVEAEFLPYVPFEALFLRFFNIKYIADYDDAIFHNYDMHSNTIVRKILENKIKQIIKKATFVVTGSPYLTAYAQKHNAKVVEIPTSIDFRKYDSATVLVDNSNKFIIGWIGSQTTSVNVLPLIPVFEKLLDDRIDFELQFIGFNDAQKSYFSHLPVKYITWSAQTEVEDIKGFDIGIMPLNNTPFNKGKCAFKLVQYMACGIPTISSKFEANIKVDRNNENFFADTTAQWYSVFNKVIQNSKKLSSIGNRNKTVIEEQYSIQANHKKYLNLFDKFKSNNL